MHRRVALFHVGSGALRLMFTGIIGAVIAGWQGFLLSLPFGLTGSAVLAAAALRHRGLRIALHDHGVVVERREGREVTSFDDVDEVWFDLDRSATPFGSFAFLRGIRLVAHSGERRFVPVEVADGAHGSPVCPRFVQARHPLAGYPGIVISAGGSSRRFLTTEVLAMNLFPDEMRRDLVPPARADAEQLSRAPRRPARTLDDRRLRGREVGADRPRRVQESPAELSRLRAAPDLVPSAIEEVLRYRSPLQMVFRETRRAVEVHGQAIPAGKLVLPVIGSANRDPQQFRDPGRFDIARDPNRHVGFGHGIHVFSPMRSVLSSTSFSGLR